MRLVKSNIVSAALLFVILMALAYAVPRESFLLFISSLTFAHIVYLKLVASENFTFKQGLILVFSINVGVVLSEPLLSDDYYRFFWDGLCLHEGINPYRFLPSEIPTLIEHYPNIYEKLNSKNYYSVYTPFNLLLFYISSIFKTKITFIFIYRIIVLFFESIGLYFLCKTIKILNINSKYLILIYLNPIFILEYAINLHIEGIIISFLCIGIYFFVKNQNFNSISSLILAIQLKLIPVLILIPFFKTKGWMKTLLFGMVLFLSLFIVYMPFMDVTSFLNYKTSLSYYFTFFEFNSSVFLISKYLADYTWFGFVFLPKLLFLGVLFLILRNKKWDFYKSALFVFSSYLLTSQSVHPWYIVALFVWIPFTRYVFPLVWAYFSMWTYYTYSFEPYQQHYFYNVVEYIVLAIVLNIELKAEKSVFQFSISKT